MRQRPHPPRELLNPNGFARFVPAPELIAWARESFIDRDAVLRNEEHAHLGSAIIGALWTNAPAKSQQRTIVGFAEMPAPKGRPWVKARQEAQMREWFGDPAPDFVLTFSAPYAASVDNATFCALVEHELLHCAQAIDQWGSPKFRKGDGRPVFAIRSHDVEEFVSIVRRYGAGPAAGETAALVEAAKRKPEVAQALIDWACGTCLKAAA